MQEFDMEVTDERAREMMELLARLYADQIGMEVKSVKIARAGEKVNPLAER